MALEQNSVALRALQRVLPPQQIIIDPVLLMTYELDAAMMEGGHPDGVAFVRSAEEVAAVARWASEYGIPLVARGAGTGLSGGAVPELGGVVVEFSRLDRVLELDESGRSVSFQAGVINQTLDELVKTRGLYFPPDPASGRSSTLGGNIAENAGGPHCFKYGVTTNYITGLEVVLADGRRLRLGGRALDYPEYDLVGLLTGNEGTLAIITEASARLIRNVPATRTALAAFDTIEDAGRAVSAVIAAGLVPAAMEMMDQKCMRIVEEFAPAGLPVHAGAGLIIETDGYAESVGPQMDEVASLLARNGVTEWRIAASAAERDQIWYGRKGSAGAFARMAPAYLTLDGTVPRSRLADTLTAIARVGEELGLLVGFIFHAGDGNLHPDVFFDPAKPDEMRKVGEAWARIMALCVEAGGSITGEHGVGIEKRPYMKLMFDAGELWAFQDVKDVFDPRHLLNPGKIMPADMPARPEPTPPASTPPPVFAPATAQEAAEALVAWAAADPPQAVRVRGGGTKSAHLSETGAVLSSAALRGIEVCAPEDGYVTVAAGTPVAELREVLARCGTWVPLASPWDTATVGGLVATSFNAPLRMRYGALRDLVLALKVALPDGRVLRAGRPVVKNVAGYDLCKLFTGSHGTLGFITHVTLKLAPLPRSRATLVVPVDDLALGAQWGLQTLHLGLVASSLLLVRGADAAALSASAASAPYALVYTTEGVKQDVSAELAQVVQRLATAGARPPQPAWDAPSGSDLWAGWLRSHWTEGSTLRLGVPAAGLPDLLAGPVRMANEPFLADLANGLLYVQTEALESLRPLARAAGGYAVLLNGSESNLAVRWGPAREGTELVRGLKRRWDPRGILNPGAFLP